MVTRTINATVVHALIVNPTTKEVSEQDITLAGTYNDVKSLDKALSKLNNETTHIVSVFNTRVVGNLYGMTEQEFLAHASIIEKPAKEDEATAE